MFRKKSVLLGVCLVFILSAAFIYADEAELQRLRVQGEKEGWTFTVGKTSVSDIPLEQLCGLKIPKKWWKNAPFDGCKSKGLLGVPASFDWRDYGNVTSVKNQGSCGASWAFAMLGSYEGILAVDGQGLNNLSEQFLVRCNSHGYGCNGGWWCYDDMYDGIPLESCYPYTATDGSCNHSCNLYFPVDSPWYYVGNGSSVPSTSALKQAIYDYGPLSVAVYVNSAFQSYTSGIFNSCSNSMPNHAVVLVGWNDSGGYWIMKNSWGTGWGENGYMRITYGCSNIGYAASYALPDSVTPQQPPVANFSADPTTICAGGSVNFTDTSLNSPTSWSWTFEGGDPYESTLQNPTGIEYTTPGTYDVTLIVTNAAGSDTETKVDYIIVPPETSFLGIAEDMDLMVHSVNYVEQALAEAKTIFGQMDVLAQHWDEGSNLWVQAIQALGEQNYRMQIELEDPDTLEPVLYEVDLTTPFITLDEFFANEAENLAQLEQVSTTEIVKKIFAKVLSILGIDELAPAIFDLLDEAGLISELEAAVESGSLKRIASVIKKILKKMASKAFFKKLVKKIGREAAERLLGKILARFIPWVGWAIIIGELLWAIGEQIFFS